MRIRNARPDEARTLSALMLRSKAHWGYDAAFLAACRDELTLAADEMAARRVVVAEDARSGELLGVGSLEGEAPDGTLGLLFVEPRLIGRGIGRTLYAHLLDTARAAGFTRLTLHSDPHATGFYRALGARPVPGGGPLPRLRVELPARAAWLHAWTGGRRAVHLGNIAEFQAQFGAVSPAGLRAAGHYACLAALIGPHPAAVVLPRPVPAGWIGLLARQLAWEQVEMYDDLSDDLGDGPGHDPAACPGHDPAAAHVDDPAAGHGDDPAAAHVDDPAAGHGDGPSAVAAGVLARPALAARLRALGVPFVAWGHTAASAELSGAPLPPGALRHESKRASHALFTALAPAHPDVTVPAQWHVPGRAAAVRRIAARALSGAGSVVKTEHGVGGSGTRVITSPRHVMPALRALPRGPLLVEEYLTDTTTPGDPTYDGVVDAAGAVHSVGVGAMDVRGTAYQGVTVGPGAVPGRVEAAALAFGEAVGRELAANGYRGWYDVDFVAAPGGRLAPTEINLRLTGPSVAFMAKARLDETRGGSHVVRSADQIPLGARLPDAELMDWLCDLTTRCTRIGAVLLPTIPTAAFEPAPWVGVLLAARTLAALDAAEALVRTAAQDLGRMFTDPG
ncbi:GNAT family N-acetyltransferase [Streptomyces sp. NPDC087420]|uniref:GNAT family N-acetyltransferase n=1 Tax=Streptomyces sp. NPDC087420 TaxID=3365785 RepID=UPI0038326355